MTFDKKEAIARWRTSLAETGSLFEADLDELESHLHDHVDALEEVGFQGEEAFTIAAERLGDTRALGLEFAKINPLLAWRAALFWICAGLLFVLGGHPFLLLATRAVLFSIARLELSETVATTAIWLTVVAGPVTVMAVLFHLAHRRVSDPLPWAHSRIFRIGIVVAASVLMLAAHLGINWGYLNALELRPASLAYRERWMEGWRMVNTALYALTVVAPLQLGFTAYRERARALRGDRTAAPLFWLAVGLFVGVIRSELHDFVQEAAMKIGGIASLGPAQTKALVWMVALSCPCLLFVSTYSYLRHRAPGPSQLLHARTPMLALGVSGVVGIGSVFLTGSIGREHAPIEVLLAASDGWLYSGILMSALLPLVVGTLMLSLRSAARLVSAG